MFSSRSLRGFLCAVLALGAVLAMSATALGAPAPFTLRFSANAPGDVSSVGNTVLTCPTSAAGCAAAQAGGVAQNNGFGMTFVDIDADPTTFNSSRAQLDLPSGATVLFAGLYWGAKNAAGGAPGAAPAPDQTALASVKFATPGSAGYSTVAGAIVGTSNESGANYHAFANVTAQVQAAGAGTYGVANVQAGRGSNSWGGWSLVVAYRDPAAPFRNLTVFDGYQVVSASTPAVTIPVSGFVAPPSGPVRARLGVMAYDGDKGSAGSIYIGDSLRFNGTAVSDALNPANDFFNSSITRAGTRITAKQPDFANQLGLDIDTVAVDPLVANGATSATIALSTGGETYAPGVVTLAIDLFAPTLQSQKTVTDLNGGQVEPGDVLQYGVSLTNTGLDAATNVSLSDAIPAGTVYEPGSLSVASGANAGPKTDPAGDDQGEFGANAVTVRLGTGANATTGGALAIGASTSMTFRVRVGAGTPNGTLIPNAASVAFKGATTGTDFTDTTNRVDVTVVVPPVVVPPTPPVTPTPPTPTPPTVAPGGAVDSTPDARLGITVDGPPTARVATVVRYCVAVTNRSRVAARSVGIRVPIPAGAVAAGVPSGARLSSGTLVWPGRNLAAGAKRTVCFSLRLLGPAGSVRAPRATAVAANAGRVSALARTRLTGTLRRVTPAVTG